MLDTNLFVSDLDATLLNDDGELSDYSRLTLTEMLNDGLPMTIASARSTYSMRFIMAGVPLSLPVIEFNGAFVSDWKTGHHLHCETIPIDAVREIYHQGDARNVTPFVTTVNHAGADKLYAPTPINPEMVWLLNDRRKMNDPRLQMIPDATHDFLGEGTVCMTFVGHQADVEGMRDWVATTLDTQVVWHFYENNYHKGWFWLSVHPPEASKGRALCWLADYLNMETRHMCVFGDQHNDESMFSEAGHSVAVSNAIPSIRSMATEIIGASREDSVVNYLKRAYVRRRT